MAYDSRNEAGCIRIAGDSIKREEKLKARGEAAVLCIVCLDTSAEFALFATNLTPISFCCCEYCRQGFQLRFSYIFIF
jgi:hypothetical protein